MDGMTNRTAALEPHVGGRYSLDPGTRHAYLEEEWRLMFRPGMIVGDALSGTASRWWRYLIHDYLVMLNGNANGTAKIHADRHFAQRITCSPFVDRGEGARAFQGR
jgi:hypothetical protein